MPRHAVLRTLKLHFFKYKRLAGLLHDLTSRCIFCSNIQPCQPCKNWHKFGRGRLLSRINFF